MTSHGSIGTSTLMSPSLSSSSPITQSDSSLNSFGRRVLPLRNRYRRSEQKSAEELGNALMGAWNIDFTPFGQEASSLSTIEIPKASPLQGLRIPLTSTLLQLAVAEPSPLPQVDIMEPCPLSKLDVTQPSPLPNLDIPKPCPLNTDTTKASPLPDPDVAEASPLPHLAPMEDPSITNLSALKEDSTLPSIGAKDGSLDITECSSLPQDAPIEEPLGDVEGPSDFTNKLLEYIGVTPEENEVESDVFDGRAPEQFSQLSDEDLTEPVDTSTPRNLVTPPLKSDLLAIPRQQQPSRDLETPQPYYAILMPKTRGGPEATIAQLQQENEQLKLMLQKKDELLNQQEEIIQDIGELLNEQEEIILEIGGSLMTARKRIAEQDEVIQTTQKKLQHTEGLLNTADERLQRSEELLNTTHKRLQHTEGLLSTSIINIAKQGDSLSKKDEALQELTTRMASQEASYADALHKLTRRIASQKVSLAEKDEGLHALEGLVEEWKGKTLLVLKNRDKYKKSYEEALERRNGAMGRTPVPGVLVSVGVTVTCS
jgi:hypothetical protein